MLEDIEEEPLYIQRTDALDSLLTSPPPSPSTTIDTEKVVTYFTHARHPAQAPALVQLITPPPSPVSTRKLVIAPIPIQYPIVAPKSQRATFLRIRIPISTTPKPLYSFRTLRPSLSPKSLLIFLPVACLIFLSISIVSRTFAIEENREPEQKRGYYSMPNPLIVNELTDIEEENSFDWKHYFVDSAWGEWVTGLRSMQNSFGTDNLEEASRGEQVKRSLQGGIGLRKGAAERTKVKASQKASYEAGIDNQEKELALAVGGKGHPSLRRPWRKWQGT